MCNVESEDVTIQAAWKVGDPPFCHIGFQAWKIIRRFVSSKKKMSAPPGIIAINLSVLASPDVTKKGCIKP